MQWQMNFGERPWHRWFAWYPVRLQGTDTRVWWEYVERRTYNAQGYICHHYRALTVAGSHLVEVSAVDPVQWTGQEDATRGK